MTRLASVSRCPAHIIALHSFVPCLELGCLPWEFFHPWSVSSRVYHNQGTETRLRRSWSRFSKDSEETGSGIWESASSLPGRSAPVYMMVPRHEDWPLGGTKTAQRGWFQRQPGRKSSILQWLQLKLEMGGIIFLNGKFNFQKQYSVAI